MGGVLEKSLRHEKEFAVLANVPPREFSKYLYTKYTK